MVRYDLLIDDVSMPCKLNVASITVQCQSFSTCDVILDNLQPPSVDDKGAAGRSKVDVQYDTRLLFSSDFVRSAERRPFTSPTTIQEGGIESVDDPVPAKARAE